MLKTTLIVSLLVASIGSAFAQSAAPAPATQSVGVPKGKQIMNVNRKPQGDAFSYCESLGGRVMVDPSTCSPGGRACSGGCFKDGVKIDG